MFIPEPEDETPEYATEGDRLAAEFMEDYEFDVFLGIAEPLPPFPSTLNPDDEIPF